MQNHTLSVLALCCWNEIINGIW